MIKDTVIIDNLCDKLHISPVIKEDILKMYEEHIPSIVGPNQIVRRINTLQAVIVFISVRINSLPYTQQEILYKSDLTSRDQIRGFNKMYKTVMKEKNYNLPVIDPIIFLNKIANKVSFPISATQYALKIHEMMSDEVCSLVGAHPTMRAGALIYLASMKCGHNVTQKEVAEACGVSTTALMKAYGRLYKAVKDMDVPC